MWKEKEKEKRIKRLTSKKGKRKLKPVQPPPEDEERLERISENSQLIKELERKVKDVEAKIKEERERVQQAMEPKPERMLLYGKMEHNYHLSNKKALFWNMN